MSRILTKYERETIIVFNESNDPADIFTYNKPWQKHLEKRLGLEPVSDNGFGGKTYQIGKSRIRPPRARVMLSTEEKARRAKRLAKIVSKPKNQLNLGII